MKKIFLMGRSEAGKTSLTQALKGEELHYIKTQYTNSNDDTIDSPGEYAESKRFSVGLACFPLRQMWWQLCRLQMSHLICLVQAAALLSFVLLLALSQKLIHHMPISLW